MIMWLDVSGIRKCREKSEKRKVKREELKVKSEEIKVQLLESVI